MLEVWKVLNEMGNEFCSTLFTQVESVDVFTRACTHTVNDMLPFSSQPHMYSIQVSASYCGILLTHTRVALSWSEKVGILMAPLPVVIAFLVNRANY